MDSPAAPLRKLLLLAALLSSTVAAAAPGDMTRWKAEASRVSITRDDWGIAHIVGVSDADAVFGMIYAQAEDDFPRIEANYLTALGRTAEAQGEKAIWQDLRARLYVSNGELQADYARSPVPMKRLMDAWADGLNFFLATHPRVHPKVLRRFEPWMALSFTEGSIGGDIERINLGALERFYSNAPRIAATPAAADPEPRGSNGIAIAPSLTAGGHALLLINPHTSFFFRAEQQVTSAEGLNAYGAATWGQFFIYQGFNAHAGWMHTSSGVDSVDEFAERIVRTKGRLMYRYAGGWRPLAARAVTVRYRTGDGRMGARSFTSWRTRHGPVVRSDGGKWIAFAMMNRPVEALQQSFMRTKARDLESFLDVARFKANSSNNTIFADDKGEIAYLHPQFVPRRNDRFDYTRPVDGSDPATEWGSLHSLAELPNVINPPSGWVQNTNNWPYSAAGAFSPKAGQYPQYMDMFGENPRGLHAAKLLGGSRGWTLEKLNAAAFDPDQPGFAQLLPGLLQAFDGLPDGNPIKAKLREPITTLRTWDYRWGANSVANTIAHFWAEAMWAGVQPVADRQNLTPYRAIVAAPASKKIGALVTVIDELQRDFGRWQVPWGEVNRFQRISPAIDHPFSDAAPSIPVPFGSGRWGSLASFGAGPKPGTKRWYGTNGNSFVAVVKFGRVPRALAVTAGGESGDPASPHFNDQAGRYAAGALRPVYFTPQDLAKHVERRYHPGE